MGFFRSKKFRVFLLAVLDICAVAVATLGALALRFDIEAIPREYLAGAVKSMPVYFAIAVLVMAIFRLYNRVWTYASSSELFSIIKASVVIEAFFVCYHVIRQISMPRSYFLLSFGIMTVLFVCTRFAKAVLKSMHNSHSGRRITTRVMVIGAGSAAASLIKEFREAGSGTEIVCAIDDNKNKKNKYLLGVPIVGDRNEIERNVVKYDIDEIIIAMPSANVSTTKEIIRLCQETGKKVKILPALYKSLTSSLAKEIRPVSYEDLLGRDPIKVDQEGIGEFLSDRIVLVTGGGGSIGQELCRQIAGYGPKKLIIFDIYENNAYDIQMELKRNYPDLDLVTLIASVREKKRIQEIFEQYRPDIVYHAAAHKHVPLMEDSPNEAIKNNVLGTYNVAEAADKYHVKKMVLISTDKAVRPTNVMGASKRICEIIIQVFAQFSKTEYAAVRFGNVLGSNGSVIPLFRKQIEKGGPVTVTDPEIIRYFMTIPEAVNLVLLCGAYAKGGEIFILDMGEPVKILDLAKKMIRLSGYVPGEDIKIEFTGLRPGEKLYEELLIDEKNLVETENKRIFVVQMGPLEVEETKEKIDHIIRHAYEADTDIRQCIKEIVPEYKRKDGAECN